MTEELYMLVVEETIDELVKGFKLAGLIPEDVYKSDAWPVFAAVHDKLEERAARKYG